MIDTHTKRAAHDPIKLAHRCPRSLTPGCKTKDEAIAAYDAAGDGRNDHRATAKTGTLWFSFLMEGGETEKDAKQRLHAYLHQAKDLRIGFTRRKYGAVPYCWASVKTHTGENVSLGDPWPSNRWPEYELYRIALDVLIREGWAAYR